MNIRHAIKKSDQSLKYKSILLCRGVLKGFGGKEYGLEWGLGLVYLAMEMRRQ